MRKLSVQILIPNLRIRNTRGIKFIFLFTIVMIYSLGEWDLRQASDEGRLKTLIRWVIKGTDEVHKITRDLFNQGKINGTQWTLIVNVDKFNAEQHLCAKCLTLFTDFATMYEKHFPGAAEEIILINGNLCTVRNLV